MRLRVLRSGCGPNSSRYFSAATNAMRFAHGVFYWPRQNFSYSSLHVFYTRSSSLCQPFTRDQLTFSTSKSATGDQNNGPALYRRHRRLLGFMRGSDHRLRQVASRSGRPPMTTWMLVLAGASTLLLFVYLVYALLRAEDLE
jgi:K+-transporting ATPase KdpF subunit